MLSRAPARSIHIAGRKPWRLSSYRTSDTCPATPVPASSAMPDRGPAGRAAQILRRQPGKTGPRGRPIMRKLILGSLIALFSVAASSSADACPGVTGGGAIEGGSAPKSSDILTPGGPDASPSIAPPPLASPSDRGAAPSASPPSAPNAEADCMKAGGKWHRESRTCEVGQ
jgi:hypothetical protein